MAETEPVHALSLDSSQQQTFVRYFRSLPEKSGSTIRFFNRSDFYTVHGEDAVFTAQELFGTHTIKYMGEQPKLSYLVLSRTNFEKYVRNLLLVKQYRVEVYVKASLGKNNDWSLEYKGSPGNLTQFEAILFENTEVIFNSVVMAVKIVRNTMIAIGCVNATEGQFFVSEFNDNELFTELEAFIAQVSPKECLIAQGESAELNTIKNMLERSGILVTRVKKSNFSADNIDQDLQRLLFFYDEQQRNVKAVPEYSLTDSMECLAAAIMYLNLGNDEQNFNQYKLSTFDAHRFLRIDNAAVYALSLLSKPETSLFNKSAKYSSVYGVLDKCCTPQGRRLLEHWLKQPLRDLNLIQERLNVVESLLKDSETRGMLSSNNLTRVPDLLILAKKLGNKKATLQDCFRVYQTVSNIPSMVNVLKGPNCKVVKSTLIDPLCDLLTDLEKYQSMIEQTLDLDMVDRGEFLIQSSFDDELQALASEKKEIEEMMQKYLRKAAQDLGLEAGKSIKLDFTDQHGYFFKVAPKEQDIIRHNNSYQIIDVVKAAVRFTNDKLSEINEEYKEINKKYEQQQKNVVVEVLGVASGYADTLRNLNICIAKVDVLVSFANVAANAPVPYVRPKLHPQGSGILKLKKVRHPCLEMLDRVTCIPNDVEFKKDEKMFHVITGPNMGGKSTYIRSIGIAVHLAHIGSFVPCSEADISVVDSILARVGANDSQLKGLSTFMLEMVETSSIIKTATSDSLVIIDELGRGTSTYDGCGIAWAIAEHLATETKCFSLFATHFHEITQLEELIPSVSNLHVTAVITEKTITPLYQVREGACDKSYGIYCARLVGFPEDVVNMAVNELENLEDYEGMKKIKDYKTNLKQQVIQEGDQLIKEALVECKSLDLSNLSDDDLKVFVMNVKTRLQAKENPFVNGLLEKSQY